MLGPSFPHNEGNDEDDGYDDCPYHDRITPAPLGAFDDSEQQRAETDQR